MRSGSGLLSAPCPGTPAVPRWAARHSPLRRRDSGAHGDSAHDPLELPFLRARHPLTRMLACGARRHRGTARADRVRPVRGGSTSSSAARSCCCSRRCCALRTAPCTPRPATAGKASSKANSGSSTTSVPANHPAAETTEKPLRRAAFAGLVIAMRSRQRIR